jgi:alkylhydroperoxidase family enzyme
MSRRGVAPDRASRLHAAAARLTKAVLGAPGATGADVRNAAFAGASDDPAVAGYVAAVRHHAHRITDEDLQRLRDAGLTDDAIFELTAAAALGAADERLQAGLSVLGATP